MPSPTQRTLAYARKHTDYQLIEVVERWNPHARCRQDLFGIIDILLCSWRYVVGVQATSGTNRSARVAKLLTHKNTTPWLSGGRQLEVWSWHHYKVKRGGVRVRYVLKRTAIERVGDNIVAREIT